ncbi:MAG: UbiA prenyltransferase family protein [Thermoplasmatales archaeon]|nr:MAG: UbiA prenyltransferase family protein [Thermoplasmatales archaeon]
MSNIISDYVKLLRLPGLGGLATPAIFGAISVGITDLSILAILFLIGAFSVIYGFVLNDYADVEIDKLTSELYERPLVKGTISKKTAVFICFICVIGAFLSITLLYYNSVITYFKLLAVLCISLAGIFGSIYNLYGKKIIGSDFLVAISNGLIILFGALAVTQETTINVVTWVIVLLTFNQLLYMNAIEGGLKDADHDYKLNVNNIALRSGVKVDKKENLVVPNIFKAFGLGIRFFSALLVFVPFVFFGYSYEIWQIAILVLLILGVFYSTIKMLNMKKFDRSKLRKLITTQAYLRYSMVPIMLISIIGILGGLILIFYPILWYILLAPFSGEKLFKPRM